MYIYKLWHPTSNKIYVGKTVKRLRQRLSGHIYESKTSNNKKANWIKSLLSNGMIPEIELLMECEDREWQEWEIAFIAAYRLKLGNDLVLNGTDGGDGVTMTDEIKEKCREAAIKQHKEKAMAGSNNPFFGKKHSKETRLAMRERKTKLSENDYLEIIDLFRNKIYSQKDLSSIYSVKSDWISRIVNLKREKR